MLSTMHTCELMEYMQTLKIAEHGRPSPILDDMIKDCRETVAWNRLNVRIYDRMLEGEDLSFTEKSWEAQGKAREQTLERFMEERRTFMNSQD